MTGATQGAGRGQPREGARRELSLLMLSADATQSILEAAMRGASMRQTLLTNNLANADTPNFEPTDVNFQSQLQSAISSGASVDNLNFQPAADPSAAGPGGVGVNADQQSAQLAENGLLYDALAQ